MRKEIEWFAWLVLALLGSGVALGAASLDDSNDLATFMDGMMGAYLKEGEIPSAVVAVVKDGHTLFAKGYGNEDISKPSPVDPGFSTFRIGSISKLFTWTAVMQLVEQGKLDLDTDVNTYLRGFQLPKTFAMPITLRALMTHTAGFEDGSFVYLEGHDPTEQLPIATALRLHMPWRVRPPFMLPAYSNYGAALAGLIVEQVSGLPFNEYIRRNIFEPLGMRHTTFEEPLPPSLSPHAVVGYTLKEGDYVKQPFEFIGGFRPAGAASATADDMTRFMLAHLQQGEYQGARILRPATLSQMHSVAFQTDRRLPGMALGFYELGVGDLRIIGHTGDTDYFHSELALIPAKQVGLFISYVGGGNTEVRDGVLHGFLGRYFPQPVSQPPPLPPQSLDMAALEHRYGGACAATRRNFSGIYKLFTLGRQLRIAALDNGRLLVAGLGPQPRQFAPVGPDLFQQVHGDLQIAFRMGADGRAREVFFSDEPYVACERTPWNESSGLWQGLLLACGLVFLLVPIALYRLNRNRQIEHRWALHVAGGTGAWALLTVAAACMAVVGMAGSLIYGIPSSLQWVLTMPLIFLGLTLVAVVATVKVWQAAAWTRTCRILFSLQTAAAVLLSLFFYQWNVLGWRFG